jgi:hypothetical protein
VDLDGSSSLVGSIVRVTIDAARQNSLAGRLVPVPAAEVAA